MGFPRGFRTKQPACRHSMSASPSHRPRPATSSPIFPRGVAIAIGLCLALFGWLALRGPAGDFLQWENAVLRALRNAQDPTQGVGPVWLPEVVRDVTAMGSVAVLSLTIVGVMGYLLLLRAWRVAALILVATVGGTILMDLLKNAIGRVRPDIVPHLMHEVSASFPSGHSMMSSVVYLTLAVLLGETVARRRERAYFFALGGIIITLVGLSRIYLGVHYPTDVLAGWAAGTAWALFCWCIAQHLEHRHTIETPAED